MVHSPTLVRYREVELLTRHTSKLERPPLNRTDFVAQRRQATCAEAAIPQDGPAQFKARANSHIIPKLRTLTGEMNNRKAVACRAACPIALPQFSPAVT
jgi:hypothetical protein